MLQREQKESSVHSIAFTLELYSLHIFKVRAAKFEELLRLQRILQPPHNPREIYRSIYPYTFWQYSKLPKLVSDALFGCFSQRNKCDSSMFYSAIRLLIDGQLDEAGKVTFAMFDFNRDELISKNDCSLLLNSSVANPSLFRYLIFYQRPEEQARRERMCSLAIQDLFGKKQKVSKCEYMDRALDQENSIHALLWDFIQDHFNIIQHLQNIVTAQTGLCEVFIIYWQSKDSSSQDSLSSDHRFYEGFLLLEKEDGTLESKYYKLVNRELLEFRNASDDKYTSLKYLGHEAFVVEEGRKLGEYYKFTLQTGTEILSFCTESEESHDYWVEGLKKAVGEQRHRKVNNFYRIRKQRGLQLRRAKCLMNGNSVLVKTVQKEKLCFEEIQQIRQEISNLEICRAHPHINKLVDSFEESEAFYLVFEACKERTLKDYFVEEQKRIRYPVVRAIARQLCSAVAYLKKYGILHRNINPESIFLTGGEVSCQNSMAKEIKAPEIQLGNLSFSTVLRPKEERSKLCGLASFMAPEAFKFSSYAHPADMYSLGVSIYFIMTGGVPFFHKDIKRFYK